MNSNITIMDRGSEETDSNHSEGDVVVVMEEEFENDVGSGYDDEASFYGAVDGVIAQFEKKAQKDKVRVFTEKFISQTDDQIKYTL